MAQARDITKIIEVPEGVTVSYENRVFVAKGPKGDVSKALFFPNIDITIEPNQVTVGAVKVGKAKKKLLGTTVAHVKNVVQGASLGYVYKLKVCSGHFPMTASLSGDTFSVKNYLGEKVPRVLKVKTGAKVQVDGENITVESPNKEIAGQVAADIEQLMRITNRDRRVFQDGIFITEKNGKAL